jgi:CRISPR-associated endonuclease/helicase Cas3
MLLAKKTPPGGSPVTLVQHTRDVWDAAEALFGVAAQPTRLGEQWLRFFRLNPATDFLPFASNLVASCLFHDWGKANDHMQTLLNGGSGGQLFRHEHLSVLLLGYAGVDAWVRQRTDIDWDVVLAAVGSHHLKFADDGFAAEMPDQTVRMSTDDPEFQEQLVPLIAKQLNLNGSPRFPSERYWGFANDGATFDPSDLRDALKDGRLRRLTLTSRDGNQPKGRMLNAVRAALISADAAGSGLRRTGITVADWIARQFDATQLCEGPFVERIVQERVDDLAGRGKWNNWNAFQLACDLLPARSLLLAPCGAGKTLAAWRWIAARVKQRPVKRILFLYPTRATATEGFKDYVSWAPETDASLMHGTADYDFSSSRLDS